MKMHGIALAVVMVAGCAGPSKNTDNKQKQTPIQKPCPTGYVENIAGQCEQAPAAPQKSERRRAPAPVIPREPVGVPSLPPLGTPGVIR